MIKGGKGDEGGKERGTEIRFESQTYFLASFPSCHSFPAQDKGV